VPELRALVVDWGGVLTTALDPSMRAWARRDDIDFEVFQQVMRDWLGNHQGDIARVNPVYALERGEMEVPHFEEELAGRLAGRSGRTVVAGGLLQRMFDHFTHVPDMAGLVLRAHRAGLRTALLSNSWGNEYPRDGWDEMFDAVVISGEVGMRKPEPEIFAHTLDLLEVAPGETVFVDDLSPNVRAAVGLGLVGVLHTSYDETASELEALFGIPLRD
jgi:epoxide hydrolase-like predicted phosphatase